jgi:hypothetical protein
VLALFFHSYLSFIAIYVRLQVGLSADQVPSPRQLTMGEPTISKPELHRNSTMLPYSVPLPWVIFMVPNCGAVWLVHAAAEGRNRGVRKGWGPRCPNQSRYTFINMVL